MNSHLSRAKDYIAKGEDFYQRAADEIVAARRDDPTLGWGRIGQQLGKSESWCWELVQWRTNPRDAGESPFGGSEKNEARYQRQAKALVDQFRTTARADRAAHRTGVVADVSLLDEPHDRNGAP